MHTVFFLEINLFYINITTSRRANAHQACIDLASSLHQTRINQTRTKLAPNSRQTRTKLAPNSHQRSDDQTRIKLASNSRQTRVKLTPNSRFYLIFENSRCYSEHSFWTSPMTCHNVIWGRFPENFGIYRGSKVKKKYEKSIENDIFYKNLNHKINATEQHAL